MLIAKVFFIFIVDKALLDDEELDHRTIPIRDVILLADYRERLAVRILKYSLCYNA